MEKNSAQLFAELNDLIALSEVLGGWTDELREKANFTRRCIMLAQRFERGDRMKAIKYARKVGMATPAMMAELAEIARDQATQVSRGKLLYRQYMRNMNRKSKAKKIKEMRLVVRLFGAKHPQQLNQSQFARLEKARDFLKRSRAAKRTQKRKRHTRLVDQGGELQEYIRNRWRIRYGVPPELKARRRQESSEKRAQKNAERENERRLSIQLRREFAELRIEQRREKEARYAAWAGDGRHVSSVERLRTVLAMSLEQSEPSEYHTQANVEPRHD